MCDSNYARLKNYNTVRQEAFEVNTGFIEFSKIVEGSATFISIKSDISSSSVIITPDTKARNDAIAQARQAKQRAPVKSFFTFTPVSNGERIPVANRVGVKLDKIPLNTELVSIQIFTKNIDGFYVLNPQAINNQMVAYDSSTQLLHIGNISTDILTQVLRPQAQETGPIVRIVVNW
jgi:hypothetical protein